MSGVGADLVLLGLRGSGKTTIAARAGRELGRVVIDLDERTPRYAGRGTVREVFDDLGEAAFRDAEVRALADVLAAQDADVPRIIALGGGTPTASSADGTTHAADLLREARDAGRAVLVYLRLRPESLRERVRNADNAHRPALTAHDPLTEIQTLHAARDPLYRQLANTTIDCDGREESATIALVLRAIGPFGATD